MKNYKVTAASVTIRSGVIGLSEAQAKDRAHLLKALGDGLYELLSPTQFKRGEEFGYDGDTNKVLLQHIQETDQESEAEEATTEGDGEQEGEGEATPPPVTNPHNANRRNRGR